MFIQSRSPILKYAFLVPLIVFAVSAAGLFVFRGTERLNEANQSFFQLFGIFLLLMSPMLYFATRTKTSFWLRRQFQKQIDSSPALQKPQRIEINDSGVTGSTELSKGETRWEAVIEAIETGDHFYLFTAKKMAMILPKRAFANNSEIDQMRELVITKLGSKATLLQ